MSQVLYRKYRSQDFDQLIGQEHITKILKNAVKNEKLSHAYLFVGSRGTGKTSTARILAKAINCENLTKDGNPCNECSACKTITEGRFLDLIEIDAASNRGIDQIRELKERLEFSPSEGKFKVYIIDEVHMLTKEAFNALLKTLEEPPAHVIFMLATTDVHKLPATILSRCQRYDFKLGTEEEIKKIIEKTAKNEKIKLEKEALDILVTNAHGSYRDSLSLLDVVVSGQIGSKKPEEVSGAEVRKILGIPDSTMVYYLLEKLVQKDAVAALDMISELDSKGVNLQQFVKYVLSMLRDILVKQIRGEVDPAEYSFALDITPAETIALINHFLGAERNLKNLSTPILALEMIIPAITGGQEVVAKKVESKKEELNKEPKQSEKVEESEEEEEVDVEEEVVEETENVSASVEVVNVTDLTLKSVEQRWGKFIELLKPANGHLYAFIGSAKVVNLEGTVLKLEVPFEFHKDRIESVKSRDVMAGILKEVFGFPLKVVCEVNALVKKKRTVSADVVLKNLPEKQKPVENTASSPNEGKKYTPKENPKKTAEIEAIFEGM